MAAVRKIDLLLIFITWAMTAPAQGTYYFEQQQVGYAELSGGVQLNTVSWAEWSSYPNLPIGFPFPFFDQHFSHLNLEVSSRLVFDSGHLYFLDPLAMVHLVDAPQAVISTHQWQEGSQQVFAIQYHEVALKNDTSKRVNFQVRLFENGTVEYHFGDSDPINPATDLFLGPYSGLYHASSVSPVTFAEGHNLIGPPQQPKDTVFSGTPAYLSFTLGGIPDEGQIFRFVRYPSVGMEERLEPTLDWYLDHVESRLVIDSSVDQQLKLMDSQGRVLWKGTGQRRHSIPFSSWSAGIYFLQESSSFTHKIYLNSQK